MHSKPVDFQEETVKKMQEKFKMHEEREIK